MLLIAPRSYLAIPFGSSIRPAALTGGKERMGRVSNHAARKGRTLRTIDPGRSTPVCYETFHIGRAQRVYYRPRSGRKLSTDRVIIWAEQGFFPSSCLYDALHYSQASSSSTKPALGLCPEEKMQKQIIWPGVACSGSAGVRSFCVSEQSWKSSTGRTNKVFLFGS